ncbi:MAG: peptidoglycan DD-metalloendopeptidase family protein [Synechocystis sp.]|nr:peptidoglycan DD-metalloendopeptidase family protein [Synechocystis sp.]
MKDVLTPQATLLIPSLLSPSANDTVSPLTPMQQGHRLACRSAAMLGLAVSMGASSFLFAPSATATDSSPLSPLASLHNLPLESPPNTENEGPLAAPSVKYKVQAGESLWQIGQAFQVQPEAIAAINQIDAETTLTPGQSLKIPTLSPSAAPKTPQPVAVRPTLMDPVSSPSQAAPLDSPKTVASEPVAAIPPLPSALKTAKAVVKPEAQAAIADVSRPIQVIPADAQGASTSLENAAKGIGIDVAPPRVIATPAQVTAAAYGNEPISILVTPPEEVRPVETVKSQNQPVTAPESSPLPELPDVVAVPYKASKDDETVSGEAVSLDTLRRTGVTIPEKPVETAFNAPIAIPVTPPTTEMPMARALPDLAPTPSTSLPPAIAPTFLPAPQVAPPSASYTVQSGDTLNQIARRHNIDPMALKRVNGLTNPNQIKINQVLVIPQTVALAPSIPTVPVSQQPTAIASVDSEPDALFQQQLKAEVTQLNQGQPMASPRPTVVASTPASLDQSPDWEDSKPLPADFNQPRQDLAQLQRQYAPQAQRTTFSTLPSQIIGAAPSPVQDYNHSLQIPVGQEVSPELPPLNTPDFPKSPGQFTGYSWPAKGVLTSGYGRRWGRMHRGIDIAGPIGTPIMAAASGEVISAGWNAGGFGKLVKIRHADGSITYYAHNNRILVRQGEYVEQGQQVAEMGSTGRSTGPHLHFEIRPDGKSAINPIALLPRK